MDANYDANTAPDYHWGPRTESYCDVCYQDHVEARWDHRVDGVICPSCLDEALRDLCPHCGLPQLSISGAGCCPGEVDEDCDCRACLNNGGRSINCLLVSGNREALLELLAVVGTFPLSEPGVAELYLELEYEADADGPAWY